MNKNYITTGTRPRSIVILLAAALSFAGLLVIGPTPSHAGTNFSDQYRNEQIKIAQVEVQPYQFLGVQKPKGPSQEELREAAELAHKRRVEAIEQSTRYVIETTDGRKIDCKSITREKKGLTLTTQTGTILTIAESEIKEITKFQYYNGRLNKTKMDRFPDSQPKATATDK